MRLLVPTALLIPSSACGSSDASLIDPGIEYNRRDWRHWIDADKDCQDTRQEVLIEESLVPVAFEDDRKCRVASGEWADPYTGIKFTDPGDLDIDHVVSLRAAHDSGGYLWDADRRKSFANELDDPRALRAVHNSANRSKGSRTPAAWLPVNESFRCQYIEEYGAVMSTYSLEYSPHDQGVVEYMMHICARGLTPPLPQ
jgi:hypothetical protein